MIIEGRIRRLRAFFILLIYIVIYPSILRLHPSDFYDSDHSFTGQHLPTCHYRPANVIFIQSIQSNIINRLYVHSPAAFSE